jgi:hypothetical protein
MVARFDAAADVTLDELRIELTYPRARPPSASSAIRTQPTTRSARWPARGAVCGLARPLPRC